MKNFLPLKLPNKFFLRFIIFAFGVFGTLLIAFLIIILLIGISKILPIPFSVSNQARLPVIKTDYIPEVSAKGAIIMDSDSNVVLYSKNPDLRFSTASTTKIMTALIALDYFKLDDILTVKQATEEGSVLGLQQGEQMTFENLLYAMLLPSANDAALTIAQNYPGGSNAFLIKMNQKAQKLNLYNTHYLDPAGLEDIGDYTTAFDLARLASVAIKNDTLRKVVGTQQKVITDVIGANVYKIENLNKLLGSNGVTGIKTGYTEEAGEVLVTSKLEKGKTIIIVVMGSQDRFSDTQKLLDLISNNLTYLSIHPQ